MEKERNGCFRILGMLSFETLNTDFWYLYKSTERNLKDFQIMLVSLLPLCIPITDI